MGAICGCCKPKPAEPTRQTVHVRLHGDKVQVSEGMDTDVISGNGTALADCKIDQDAAYWEAVIKALPKEGQCCVGIAQKDIALDAVMEVGPGGLPLAEPQAASKKAADDFDPSVIGASSASKDSMAFAISAAAGLEEGDVIGVAFGLVDIPNLRFYQNGKLMSSATVSKVQGQVQPAFSVAGGAELSVIFDEDSFRSTPPSGYGELIKGRGML
mmetsp:Transcript_73301/g.136997  ORF Transcript_73301/g.136997 Transcript_73301/m.136997 type:complete len:214 (+) Transcript_73301:94-735(+)